MLWGGGGSWRDEMLEPAWRFPLPAAFALLALAVNWSRPEYRMDSGSGQLAFTSWCLAAFLWSWAVALWGEARGDRLTGLLIGAGGAVLLGLVFRLDLALPALFSGGPGNGAADRVTLSHGMLVGALLFAPTLAPYVGTGFSRSAFWQYNHKWAIGCLAAAAGAVLAFAGVAAVLGSLMSLFELGIPEVVFDEVRLVCGMVVLPWIWLALSPQDFAEETKTGPAQGFTSRAVGMLVAYILIPATLALSAVLAAYVAKVTVQGSFDTARLGLTSVVYGVGVILVMLLAWPQRDGHGLVRLFWRIWPFLLVAPTLLLIPALWTRIAEYGWTPVRYVALLLGVWVTGVMLVGFVMRGREDLRLVTGLLALLLLAAGFGPWGIADVSARSQYARLEALLAARGMLIDGRWRQAGAGPWAANDDRKAASSTIEVLAQAGRLDWLRPWFEGQPDNPFDGREPGQATKNAVELKLALRGPPVQPATRTLFTVVNPTIITLPGEPAILIGPIGLHKLRPRQSVATPAGEVHLAIQGRQVDLFQGTERIATFDLTPTVDMLKARGALGPGEAVGSQALILEPVSGGKARLALTFVAGAMAEGDANLHVSAYLLLPVPAAP